MSRSIRRLGHAALGTVCPGMTGRRATDAFSATRALGTYPDDVPPLGARRFPVDGDPDVTGGYLWGDGGPVALVVHGWGTDSSSMHPLVPPLRRLGFRVAAFDAPGHGVSPGSRATMTQMTRATGAVLDALGPWDGAEVVVAHSLGSIAAIGAVGARAHPPVRGMVLVAPTCTLTGVLERWARGDGNLPRSVVERVRAELWRRNGVPVSHWDVVGLGGALEVPVLVAHDPDDPIVPFSEAEAVVAGLRRAHLRRVPGRGHMGILAADEVKDLVATFVTEHAPEATATADD